MRAPLVLTLGLYRSGSTWMFNVTRSLVAAAGARVSSDFYDGFAAAKLACPEGSDARVLKAHHLMPQAIARIGEIGGRAILTLRDPRDCVASFMTTFGRDFRDSGRVVTASCASAIAVARALKPRIYRYEDGFIDQRGTLADVGAYLGVAAGEADIDRIFGELRRSSVEAKIASLASEGVIDPAWRGSHDPVSHWHPGHIGDGRVGKYRELLTPAQIAAIERANQRFIAAFGYG